MSNIFAEGWNHLFGKSEPDPKVTACAHARQSMIGEYLDHNKGTLSAQRTGFFQQLAKEDQRPYCDGRESLITTDSAPVALTAEQLSQLIRMPYSASDAK